MLPPDVAGWRRDALEIEPDAERTHISCLLCCMNDIIFWLISYDNFQQITKRKGGLVVLKLYMCSKKDISIKYHGNGIGLRQVLVISVS